MVTVGRSHYSSDSKTCMIGVCRSQIVQRGIIAALFMIMTVVTGSSQETAPSEFKFDYPVEMIGWKDGNTFQVIAFGFPPGRNDTIPVRKNLARKAAVLQAKHYIYERFIGMTLKGNTCESCGPPESATAFLKPIINNGRILNELFDEKQTCKIIYQVQSNNLQKRISAIDY